MTRRTISPYVLTPQYDAVTGAKYGEDRAYVGGDTEVYFNAEYTFPLLKEAGVKGVLFFDIGNAADGVGDTFSDLLAVMALEYAGFLQWVH